MEGRWRNTRLHPTKRAPSKCLHGEFNNPKTGKRCVKCKSLGEKSTVISYSEKFGLPTKHLTVPELCEQLAEYVLHNGGDLDELLEEAGFRAATTKKTIERKEREREKKGIAQEAKEAAEGLNVEELLKITQKIAAIKMAEQAGAAQPPKPSAQSEVPFATGFSWFEEEGAAQRVKRRAEEEIVDSKYIGGLALKNLSDSSVQVILDKKMVAAINNVVKRLEIPDAGFLLFLRNRSYVYVGKVENNKAVLGVGIYEFQSRDGDASPIDKVSSNAAFSKQTAYALTMGRTMNVGNFNTYEEKVKKGMTPIERAAAFESLSTEIPNLLKKESGETNFLWLKKY